MQKHAVQSLSSHPSLRSSFLCPGKEKLHFPPAPGFHLCPDYGLKASVSRGRSPGSGFCWGDSWPRHPVITGMCQGCRRAQQELGTCGEASAASCGIPCFCAPPTGVGNELGLSPSCSPLSGATFCSSLRGYNHAGRDRDLVCSPPWTIS